MTRSQEALEKRAEKRAIPVEEQRLKDKRSKKSKADDSEEPVKLEGKSKPIVPIRDNNDWICSKCNNKNFHHRSECNRCQSGRDDKVASPQVQTGKLSSQITSAIVNTEVAKNKNIVRKTNEAANVNWICLSCKNDNFPTRTACNRCHEDRPSTARGKTETTEKIGNLSNINWICISCKNDNFPTRTTCNRCQSERPNNSEKKSIITGKGPKIAGPISGKSLSWGKQATEKEIAENKRLREAVEDDLEKEELTDEQRARAVILKERSIRKKEKKEQQLKWKEKKLKLKGTKSIPKKG
mmetsp:Transcript_26306/g.25141  ORF Transcript_26306/g.25141 Transcript_26306/m.25141 type:complete len:297 (+) Transcript_26306:102-992(+)